MDENKRLKLIDIGYKILDTCGNCLHGTFDHNESFGTCDIQTYQHLKHSQKERNLSINIYGTCPKHERHPGELICLGAYKEFIK